MACYSPQFDPQGAPWTAQSVTLEINRLAYEQFRLNTQLGQTDVQDAQINDALTELEVCQRELQAIAGFIAQGPTPSVVGPGAINVTTTPAGTPIFVATPQAPTPVATTGVPAGTRSGTSQSGAMPGVMGPLPSQPSLPANNSGSSIAGPTTEGFPRRTDLFTSGDTTDVVTAGPERSMPFISRIAEFLRLPVSVVAAGLLGIGALLLFGGSRRRG